MFQKILNWLKGAWISFQVAENTHRLIFLIQAMDDWISEQGAAYEQAVTMVTYKNTVSRFLTDHPRLDGNIWPLDQASDLRQKSETLIEIGERLLYGTD